jgi:glyoxylase-like metal-dependent hydrolase (beta-lactamase superfamily II)
MGDGNNDEFYFGSLFREFRHNPCLMAPVSLGMFVVFGLFMILTLLIQVPTLVLGLLLAPILQRSSWYVQFLYPWGVARWAHFLLIRHAPHKGRGDDKNRGFHSRTLEQRVEVVPGRVYIHLIPQWLDNVGYLVICLPRPRTENTGAVKITVSDDTDPIVAFMIDCGDAQATIRAIEMIKEHHYGKKAIQLQAILSTHKHHDHTGGNKDLLSHPLGKNITRVYGGAVEKVPHSNTLLADGDSIELPSFQSNDMNQIVGVEAVAVPAHTRGSMVYRLYCKTSAQVDFLFTGDTMFSAGGGVPFEADTGNQTETQINKSNGNTFFRGGTGNHAIERCFAEILTRGLPNDSTPDATDRVLVFPGHEYTSELLNRQFSATNDACKWKNFAPKEFFDTVSHLYIAQHRRSLPHNSGRILMIPSTLKREISISPHFRSMKRNGEMVVRSIHFWYTNFCEEPLNSQPQPSQENGNSKKKKKKLLLPPKTASTPRQWNIEATDVSRDVFATVYSLDLETVIEGLADGNLSKMEAAKQLRELTNKLKTPVINKRAIPGYLPSDKNIYKGVSSIALLGSRPSGMSISDSRAMRLSRPIDSNSDKILVSKKRLLQVLTRIGLVDTRAGGDGTAAMLVKLWKQASEYVPQKKTGGANGYGDMESGDIVDEIELGILKWVIYGVPANQPSWFSKICCMPCSNVSAPMTFADSHPAAEMSNKSGDLVAHDVLSCNLCLYATGCAQITTAQGKTAARPTSSLQVMETESDDDSMGADGLEVDELTSHLLLKEHE